MKLPNSLSPFFDREEELRERRCRLPHWFQEEKMQYITFRLNDSLPQCVLDELKKSKAQFILQNPQPWSEYTKALYSKHFGNKSDYWLNQGYGSCILRRPEVRRILEESLEYVNCVKCVILAYVIMPNHVHLLMLPYPGEDCEEILTSVKKFSAKHINRLLGRHGQLWQREAFDRIVRCPQHLHRAIDYIKKNPRNMPPQDYTLYFDVEALSAIDRIEVED